MQTLIRFALLALLALASAAALAAAPAVPAVPAVAAVPAVPEATAAPQANEYANGPIRFVAMFPAEPKFSEEPEKHQSSWNYATETLFLAVEVMASVEEVPEAERADVLEEMVAAVRKDPDLAQSRVTETTVGGLPARRVDGPASLPLRSLIVVTPNAAYLVMAAAKPAEADGDKKVEAFLASFHPLPAH